MKLSRNGRLRGASRSMASLRIDLKEGDLALLLRRSTRYVLNPEALLFLRIALVVLSHLVSHVAFYVSSRSPC